MLAAVHRLIRGGGGGGGLKDDLLDGLDDVEDTDDDGVEDLVEEDAGEEEELVDEAVDAFVDENEVLLRRGGVEYIIITGLDSFFFTGSLSYALYKIVVFVETWPRVGEEEDCYGCY